MGNEMDQFKDLFLQSAREHLQTLNDVLLKLESNPSQLDLVEELMRTGHSLKGESAAMGFEQIATLGHVIEDLFTGIGNGTFTINDELTNTLFSAFDHIGKAIDSIAGPDGKEISCQEYTDQIKQMTGLKTEGFGKSEAAALAAAQAAEAAQAAASASVTPEPLSVTPLAPGLAVTESATTAATVPEVTENVPTSVQTQETATPAPTTPAELPATAPAEKDGGAKTASEQITSITLKVEKLDQMVSVSEELVLLKMKLKTNQLVLENTRLKADIHLLDRLVTDLQFYVMQARLFPISLALHNIPRLVRDTAKKTGKKVQLTIEGEDTTVDRTIIDHLTEPFVHLIRNAIDHGIESPEERKKAGKPETAQLRMSAYTKENKFYVDVSDDGQGIDWDKLAAAAVKKGVITEEDAQAMLASPQKEQIMFFDGVSTNEEVTDLSGRGVGMSAVQTAIKKLGGAIMVKTERGAGTTFTIRLPMTLAIIRAMLVEIGDQTMALPANEIVRSIQIRPEQIVSSANTDAIVVDNQGVTLFDLKKIFGIPNSEKELAYKTVVLVHQDQRTIGCLVDKIISEEEVLVKPLGPLLQKSSSQFSGATILADGSAAPIVNIEGLTWKA